MPKRESAREALINAAEHLFGTMGFDAVSTRQILDHAGQKNQSALQYHFGGRDGLIWAVMEARLSVVEVAREKILAKLPPSGEETAEQLADVIVRPLAEFVHGDERGAAFVRFNIQSIHRPDFDLLEVVGRGNLTALNELWERLDNHMEHVPLPARQFRKIAILNNAVGSVAVWNATGMEHVDLEDLIRTASAATTAIMRAQ